MEKIIQLEEREYNQLFDKASLNENQIKELAEQYYQDRGVFRIDIKAEVAGNYTGYLNYKTFSFTAENGLYCRDSFAPIISERGRRKIESIMEELAKETLKNKFGDVIGVRNHYQALVNKFAMLRWICYTIAASGWTVATILIIKTLL